VSRLMSEYTPIKACNEGWYGRCRACRARRARERYQADPVGRDKQKARSARNRARARLASVRATEGQQGFLLTS
jgi:hypothetical protein